MMLGTRPFAKSFQNLVDLHDHRSDVAEVRLGLTFVEILIKCGFQQFLMIKHRLLELFQLFDAKIDAERRAGAEVRPLPFDNRMYRLLRVHHLQSPFSSFCLRSKNRSSILC